MWKNILKTFIPKKSFKEITPKISTDKILKKFFTFYQSEIDFTVDDYGVFSWNEKAIDYCILLGQIYP